MTAKQLRDLLKDVPDDMPVYVRAEDYVRDVLVLGEIASAKIDEEYWGLAKRPHKVMFLIDAAVTEG